MKRKHMSIGAAILAGVLGIAASVVLADSIWIKSEVVEIRAGKGAIYPVVATAKKGQELTIVDREGKWLKVTVPGAAGAAPTEGYVYETAISPTKVSGGGGLSTGTQLNTAAAAKGLQPSAENYAAGKRLDSGPLNRLIAFRNGISPQEWEKFMADGKVGAQ
jgi:uncharacterized protein YgiM (DUF1202 family)